MLAPLILLGLIGSACGAASGSDAPQLPSPTSGEVNVSGTVDRALPAACPSGEACDPVIVAPILIFSDATGREVQTRVAGDGSFEVHLDPGYYTITAATPLPGAGLQPSSVRVTKSGAVTLRLHVATSS